MHKRVNALSLSLLKKHRLFKHRFSSAYEFQHIVKESAAVNAKASDQDMNRLVKAGIDVRKRLLERVSAQAQLLSLSSNTTTNAPSKSSSNLMRGIEDEKDAKSEGNASGNRPPTNLTALEFQLHSEVLSSMSDFKHRITKRKAQKKRIEELKAKRDALALEVSAMTSDSARASKTSLEESICSLTVINNRLFNRKNDLLVPIVRLAEDWDASYGQEIGSSRAFVLKSVMEAYSESRQWAVVEEGDEDAVHFFVRAGVLRMNTSNPLQVQLRI